MTPVLITDGNCRRCHGRGFYLEPVGGFRMVICACARSVPDAADARGHPAKGPAAVPPNATGQNDEAANPL